MTLSKTQRLTILKVRLTKEAEVLADTIRDIETRGVSSMTISTGDGQKSATNIDLDKLVARRNAVCRQLAAVNRELSGKSPLKIIHRMTVRY